MDVIEIRESLPGDQGAVLALYPRAFPEISHDATTAFPFSSKATSIAARARAVRTQIAAISVRPRSDFGSIFVAYVRWFARASVAASRRLFVYSFARSVRTSLIKQVDTTASQHEATPQRTNV